MKKEGEGDRIGLEYQSLTHGSAVWGVKGRAPFLGGTYWSGKGNLASGSEETLRTDV